VHLVGFYYANISRSTVLGMSDMKDEYVVRKIGKKSCVIFSIIWSNIPEDTEKQK